MDSIDGFPYPYYSQFKDVMVCHQDVCNDEKTRATCPSDPREAPCNKEYHKCKPLPFRPHKNSNYTKIWYNAEYDQCIWKDVGLRSDGTCPPGPFICEDHARDENDRKPIEDAREQMLKELEKCDPCKELPASTTPIFTSTTTEQVSETTIAMGSTTHNSVDSSSTQGITLVSQSSTVFPGERVDWMKFVFWGKCRKKGKFTHRTDTDRIETHRMLTFPLVKLSDCKTLRR